MNTLDAINHLRYEATAADLPLFAEAYKFALKRLSTAARGAFQPGQNVQWASNKRGVTMKGVVIKVNPKNTVVQTTMGNWRVANSMLRAA